MDVKTTKTNRWCLHIKDYASKNGMSYREAMRSEGCKSAYKSPVPEPERLPSPEPSPEPEVETKKKGHKKADPLPELQLPVSILVRSGPYSEPLIPTVIKKERVKRRPAFVPS